MNVIELNTATSHCKIIFCGEPVNPDEYCIGENAVYIIDETVHNLYPEKFINENKIIIPSGENHKNYETILYIIDQLLNGKFGRDALLLGIGGGVTTDLTGFAAGIYKRGVRFGFIPTTLMAMADAAVGGKNGINRGDVKNALGLIRQPEFVIIDVNYLKTLPDDEYFSAFSEIIKMALIDKPLILDNIEAGLTAIQSREPWILEKLIIDCIESKVKIVVQDEYDSGIRNTLNFGHTAAHAFELHYGLSHGYAVACGLLCELQLSENIGGTNHEIYRRVKNIFESLRFSFHFTPDFKEIAAIIANDKKKTSGKLNIILLENYSKPQVQQIDFEEIIRNFSLIRYM